MTALSVGLVGLIGCAAAPDPITSAAAMPLDRYLLPEGAPAPPSTPEEAAAARYVVENAVAACMAERGFHYVPYVSSIAGAEYAPASRAWSQRWGYGVVARVRPAADDQDPNPAVRAALSESEQVRWDDALGGAVVDEQEVPEPAEVAGVQAVPAPAAGEIPVLAAPPVLDGAGPTEVTALAYPSPQASAAGGDAVSQLVGDSAASTGPVRRGDGCRQRAENAGTVWTAYTPLVSGVDPWAVRTLVSNGVLDAPEVVAARTRWSQCLADTGHPGMAQEGDPVNSVEQAVSAVGSMNDGGQDARLTDLQAQEIALAVADHDCRASSGLTEARDAAQRAREQEYVDSHRGELEQLRDTISGGG